MWLYTLLRVALFLVLWGLVWLVGVRDGLWSAVVALVLSIPLSYVLLARPRAAFSAQIEQRLEAQRARRFAFDQELDPANAADPDDAVDPDDPEAPPAPKR